MTIKVESIYILAVGILLAATVDENLPPFTYVYLI